MLITGNCHFGNILFKLECEPDPTEIPARACTCSFSFGTKHGDVWRSFVSGSLTVNVKEPARVSKCVFGTKTAQFHLCTKCGVVPFATSRINGCLYAVVNAKTFEALDTLPLNYVSASFDEESEEARLARRKRNWIAKVEYTEGGP